MEDSIYDNYFSFLIDVGAYLTNSCSLLKTEKKVPKHSTNTLCLIFSFYCSGPITKKETKRKSTSCLGELMPLREISI